MSAAPNFTPGPWGIAELPPRNIRLKRRHWAFGQIGVPPNNRGVGLVFGETDANAQLVRAAPRLYAALEKLWSECEAMQGPELRDDPVWGPLMREAEAALSDAGRVEQ